MKSRPFLILSVALLAASLAPAVFGAAAKSDLLPSQRRQATVDTAEKLLQRTVPPSVAPEFPSPFNPPEFDRPEPSAGRVAGGGNVPRPPSGTPAPSSAPAPAPADREILETLAMRLPPAATFVRDGKPLLVMGRDRFEVGTRFIVTYNDQDYELELVSIDRTTFTLRYRGEEYTRPIRPVK